MLGAAWLRLTRLYKRLEKLCIGLASAAFFIAWLGVGVVAARHWQAISSEGRVWLTVLLWMSFVLWVGLLRGRASRTTTIGCLALILLAVAMVWSQYFR